VSSSLIWRSRLAVQTRNWAGNRKLFHEFGPASCPKSASS
jgi:hypothetical protein